MATPKVLINKDFVCEESAHAYIHGMNDSFFRGCDKCSKILCKNCMKLSIHPNSEYAQILESSPDFAQVLCQQPQWADMFKCLCRKCIW